MRRHRHLLLLVEDEGVFRDQLEDLLAAHGFLVACARHGREALQLLTTGTRPCLILLDLMKPKLAATEFRRAQSYDPELRSIPVALLPVTLGASGASRLGSFDQLQALIDVDRLRSAAHESCWRDRAFLRDGGRRTTITRSRRPPRVRANSGRTKPRS
jgi:CheY-like chemotaxis protein